MEEGPQLLIGVGQGLAPSLPQEAGGRGAAAADGCRTGPCP